MNSEAFLNLDKNFEQGDSQVKKPSFENTETKIDWSKAEF
jgi:hypothetical protein